MALAMRHRDDPGPVLAPVAGLVVQREDDAQVMAALQDRSPVDIQARFDSGHRAYVALLNGERAAWGWVATTSAEIGELNSAFRLAPRERYLWNFVTVGAFRGRGIYPRLLTAIVDAELPDADRFWIAYAPENRASGSGIRRAGFRMLAELSFDMEGRPSVRSLVEGGGHEAELVTGVPEVAEVLAACWKCTRAGKSAAAACREGECCCDYQQPAVQCASPIDSL